MVDKMASGDNVCHPPPMQWAQRSDVIYLTINLEDVEKPEIKLEENALFFKGKGGTDKKIYEVTVNFYEEVDPQQSKYGVLPRHIPMAIRKKKDGPYWPRLMKEKGKPHWLKTDFDKWRDEDDSDAEDSKDMQLEEMMKQMGNFNGGGNLGDVEDEEEDSDDEELPDLEDNTDKDKTETSTNSQTTKEATEVKS